MNIDKLALALTPPRFVSPRSAWVQHIPFALAAIDWMRPRTFVELGTYMGDSYLAFCQAVDALKLDTRCTAVDSWDGDPQAGQYPPSVLADLRRYHDPLYARFSRLLPAQFDHAAALTADRSIDLLHIDGLHTYDAVQHDWQTWLPKLSDRAVVLLHDTQVTHGNFGVHALWNAIRRDYPTFEFPHGYGLGIAAVGKNIPADFSDFLAWAQAHPQTAHALFAALGARIELARGAARIQHELHTQRAALNTALIPPANGSPNESSHAATPHAPRNGKANGSSLHLLADPDLQRSLERQIEDLQHHCELARLFRSGLIDQLATAPAAPRPGSPPATAALSLYWPNAAGRFDAQHVQSAHLPADGHVYTLRFVIDLPADPACRRLRLDPGDRPAIWRLQNPSIRLLDGTNNPPLRLPPSAMSAGQGVVLLHAGHDAEFDCLLFCGNRDPQLELALSPWIPPRPVTLEITLQSRLWNNLPAFFTAAARHGGIAAEGLRKLFTRHATAAPSNGHANRA